MKLSGDEARVRLAAIVESSQDAIVSKTLDGVITSWNSAATQLFGYLPEEIIGRSIYTLIPRELHAEEDEVLRKLRAGQRIEHYETVRVAKDGTRREVSLTISPVRDDNGTIIGASKIARDISDRRRNEEIRNRLAAIVESSDDAIISKDLAGTITSWNAAAERMFGYKADEIIGKSVLTIIPPELHSDELNILKQLVEGQKLEHHETTRLTKDGKRLTVSLTISPIKDASGRIIGASKIARDISDRKLMQEALIESEKLAATGRMAAAIAHEINNPLEAVTNLAYLISLDPTISTAGRTYAEMMMEELSRASEITKQSLAFYRDLSKPTEFDIRELMDSVIRIHNPALKKQQISVETRYAEVPHVFGFALEIRQVLTNIIGNAIEAMPDRIYVRIHLETAAHKEPRIRVTVADDGSGIAKEFRDRVFMPFFTTKGSRGNGLGLWVSQGIAGKHGAQIRVKSRVEEGRCGSVFSISLPLGKPSQKTDSIQ